MGAGVIDEVGVQFGHVETRETRSEILCEDMMTRRALELSICVGKCMGIEELGVRTVGPP